MKIAHVVCTFPPYKGGMGNSAYHFAQYTAKLKHQVTVLTIDYNQPVKDANGDQLEILRLKPIFKLGNAGILLSLLWRLPKYDVVHLHYPFYGSAEIVALAKMLWPNRLRLVVHYHMDNEGVGWKGFIFRLARKFLLPLILTLADEITCASLDYVKHSQAGKYFRHHQRKFSQVPFGVNIQKFKPLTTNRDLTAGENDRLILFVGGLDRQHYFKGVDNLLTA
ncbi:MAG: glycosyltransferase, partial [bacterium]